MTTAELFDRLERVLRAGPMIAAVTSTGLGIFVLMGWYTSTVTLGQLHPALVPMPYNSAVGFLVCGFGLLSIVYRFKKPGAALGLALVVLSLLTLIEYVYDVELGINQPSFGTRLPTMSHLPGTWRRTRRFALP